MSKQIMQQALDALDGIHAGNMTPMAEENWNKAIKVLRQALAQPEQEPDCGEAGHDEGRCGNFHCITKPAPPRKEWVSLSDTEINKIVDLNTSDDGGFDIWCDGIAVAHIVCAKLKELNK